MATYTPTILYRGSASSTTTTTIYVVPSLTTTVVTDLVVSNTGTSPYTFTVYFDSALFANTVSIPANSVVTFDIKQVIIASIQGGATNSAVTFHISGVEIA